MPSADGDVRPRRRTALFGAAAVGVVAVAFVGVLATRKSATDRQALSPLLGHPAPAISGRGVTDGAPFELSSLQGRYVLVNFFASWCIPCQHEQPQLVKFDAEPGGRTAVVSVLFSDTPGPAKAFMLANAGTWPLINDPDGQVALNYGVRGPPESYLLNPAGTVLAKFIGEVTASRLDQLVSAAQAATA